MGIKKGCYWDAVGFDDADTLRGKNTIFGTLEP